MTAVAILGALVGPGLTAGSAAASPTPKAAEGRSADPKKGACTTAEGVTVIIDFQELGGGSYTSCAPNAPATGFKALEQAGISWTPTTRSPGFLCRIAGKPANDPCHVPSPTTAYWSYWLAPRGGHWCYSNLGAGSRRPPAGTVEGWSFVLNKSASATPPPAIAPPPPLAGVPAPQLPGKDCTVPTEGAPPTTSPPPGPSPTRPAPAPTKPSNPSNPSGPSAPSGPSNPSRTKPRPGHGGSGSTNGSGPKTVPGGSSSTSSKGGGDDTTTTAPTDKTTSTTLDDDAATSDDDADGDGATSQDGVKGSGSRGITDPDEIAALEGDIDLGDDGRSKGSPVPLVAAGVVGVGLVAGGVWQRRRSQVSADPS